jgi:DNA-binding NtrC family response regulator
MAQSASHSSAPSLRGARVLVVEDDAILAMELSMILQDAGAEVAGPCRSVAEALATIGRSPDIAAAVLDVRIGRDTIAPVAHQLRRRGTAFVFYTGQIAGDPILAEYSNCRVIAKPAQALAIVSAVADLVTVPGLIRNQAHWELNQQPRVH